MRMIKAVLLLVVLGFAGLAGFAYLGDLTPVPRGMSVEIKVPGPGNGN